jgi:hypothetical protein
LRTSSIAVPPTLEHLAGFLGLAVFGLDIVFVGTCSHRSLVDGC